MKAVIWSLAAVWMGFIFYMGTSRFGRAGSQAMIDRLKSLPAIQRLLNRYHGGLRASFHYVEFVTLTILVYWALGAGSWEWDVGRAVMAYLVSCAYAYLDELHQSRTPGRMFRRIDFLHSLLGATLAITAIGWWFYLFG